jgi:tryptophanyl-tRNA synthetase
MSLKDGLKKMSKSELSDLSRINMTDEKDQIINKIKKAKTDTLPIPSNFADLEKRHEAKNLLEIYSSLKNTNLDESIKIFEGKNFSEFKEKLSEVLVDKIGPISEEIKKLTHDKNYLDKILLEGQQKANDKASKKLKKLQEIVGF